MSADLSRLCACSLQQEELLHRWLSIIERMSQIVNSRKVDAHLGRIERCCQRDCQANHKDQGDDDEASEESIALAWQPTLKAEDT